MVTPPLLADRRHLFCLLRRPRRETIRPIPHGQEIRGEVAHDRAPALADEAGDATHTDVVAVVEQLGRVQLGIVRFPGGGPDRRRSRLGGRLVDHHLAPRQEQDTFQAIDRPLRHRLEPADRSDLVAVELDPHRVRVAEAEDIDDAAAPSHVSRFLDQRHAPVAEIGEPVGEVVGIHRVADPELEHAAANDLGRNHLRGQ
jgi:hypothetical protein